MKKIIQLFIVAIVLLSCSEKENSTETSTNKSVQSVEIESKIQDILSQMTLKEKAGQMLNIGLPAILKGGYWEPKDSADFNKDKFKKFIVDYAIGSIHNTPGFIPEKEVWYQIVKTIQDSAMQKSRLGIPILYGIDNIHGANYVNGSVMFPHQIAVAATWNTELSRIGGEITSYESRAASLPWNFNPNADVATNPLWGRIGESFGEDPYLISEMTKAYIQGSQEKGLENATSTAVCVKHFVGYGAGRNGKDRANAIIPENSLRQYFLPPFEKAVENGAMGIMISSNAVNGIPCHLNTYYITDILKGEMDYKGVVISDFSDVEFLVEAHASAKDKREATKLAVNSGIDLLMNPYDIDVVDFIVELVEAGEISKERVDDAVTRILRLKFYLNLFETPYNNPNEYPEFGSEKHIAANYKTASEAITLLKNKNEILPLPSTKKILVTGYAANSINMLNGAWSRSFLGRETKYNDPTKLTILDAVKKQVGAKNVEFVAGTDYLDDINSDVAVSKAKNADYIVVCVGEIPASEKPSDINELDLPKAQQDLVKKLAKTGKPIILVLVQGRPRIIKDIEPLVDGIIMTYLPGQEGGRAIADVVFGNVNPSGKLPYTYPKYTGNILPYYYKKADIRDISWGYDGFYPQFEFGFGLSYTTFEYSNLNIDKDTLSNSEGFKVSVTVKNTGDRAGNEVVEVFVKDLVATVSPDAKKLIRFNKINLNAGEAKTVEFKLTTKDLESIGIDNNWVIELGEFEILVGGNPQELLKHKIYYKN
ncbi:glycoside hydrolase family 3 C-terminal domain-containing protein [Lutibacter sp. A64]|uniref:glycoside hydrolase family 3 N-terminal domain-containing protein n=1 Tax=Lutibacter sp. A64 TaxID=2918526 RepID=UPI001F05FA4F|nr:glycoside hydrolase family 3 N-terminal domain-containing protein [Lutibacter sp. A64]UMB52542.1 glycoside hydrolase family 3 C-terminal domain-containing protein [Lutibacter sp. A64]